MSTTVTLRCAPSGAIAKGKPRRATARQRLGRSSFEARHPARCAARLAPQDDVINTVAMLPRNASLPRVLCPWRGPGRCYGSSQSLYDRTRIFPVADVHPAAGKVVSPDALANIPRLVTAYFANKPDAADPAQRVAFGTSGHRGTSLKNSFNEAHILATTQAICDYRREKGLTGPLFIGIDTHALAEPALASAVEVFAANGVVVTPSHNPPEDGGYKYNPPHGGPADTDVTGVVEKRANAYLADGLKGVARMDYAKAKKSANVHAYDF